MKFTDYDRRNGEQGGAGIKFLFIVLVLGVFANAGINYLPVAYQAANFRQAAPGSMRPADVVKASLAKAARDNDIPPEAIIDIRPAGNVVQAQATYTRQVQLLPFGLYKYNYNFYYVAAPTGYLLKE
jgi:hypothetical protein